MRDTANKRRVERGGGKREGASSCRSAAGNARQVKLLRALRNIPRLYINYARARARALFDDKFLNVVVNVFVTCKSQVVSTIIIRALMYAHVSQLERASERENPLIIIPCSPELASISRNISPRRLSKRSMRDHRTPDSFICGIVVRRLLFAPVNGDAARG